MKQRWFRGWYWLALIPILLGLARVRFDAEVLDLLPTGVRAVEGLKLYQQHFTNARELILTVTAPSREIASRTAQTVAERLRRQTNLVAAVSWQPPWLEHPEFTAELIAHLWFNQPPEQFAQLAHRLAETNLAVELAATRAELATTMSPAEIARLSYDPYGLTRLPQNLTAGAAGLGQGEEMFASADGRFRLLFIKARNDLADYRECITWLTAIQQEVEQARAESPAEASAVGIGFTGRPAFVAEVAQSMRHDIILSVTGTAVIIAALFWLAHRRWKPMLWLLTLLALILATTLALGGLLFGSIHVVSMGFAAILLGLAVDYAVVHYQEALAHPDLSVPEIRRAIAPSIFWAAVTTITAFLVLNWGGLPGLAQLGSLVGLGVALSACVMIFAFLPPLFPNRMQAKPAPARRSAPVSAPPPPNPRRVRWVMGCSAALVVAGAALLAGGMPKMDASTDALQPRDSRAYAALNAIKTHLDQKREPLWLVVNGRDEGEVARRLDAVQTTLNEAVSNRVLTGFVSPVDLWPHPAYQSANRATAQRLVAEREALRAAALNGGFAETALGLTGNILDTWEQAAASSAVFWPTNPLAGWILEKLVARQPGDLYAVAFLFPSPTTSLANDSLASLEAQLPRDGVWLAGWELLGVKVLGVVKQNLWKLLLPMASLVLFSLWLAFRRWHEVRLSLGILLLSGVGLLAVMRVMGWSWNVLNLMALPLILGTGVDYSIFMQLALRRYHGDLGLAQRSVGRALLLCGGTAVAGFGSLGLSSNAGMASLGQVCAIGIAGNMLGSVFLLPVWWWQWQPRPPRPPAVPPVQVADKPTVAKTKSAQPSSLYRSEMWSLGLMLARRLPPAFCRWLSCWSATTYCLLQPRRRGVVTENLLPVFGGDRAAAEQAARGLFREFAVKLIDLWRFESGEVVDHWMTGWDGWELFAEAYARGQGVLLVTPHLGNWEFGGAFLAKRGYPLLVLTQAEPGRGLTEMRQNSRARWGIETLVVGEDAFAFVEIIKRLQQGATVALLVDRPPAPTAVTVELFGRPFPASIAMAELARASGCAILPTFIVRQPGGYYARVLPEIQYQRAAIGDRASRIRLTQEILRAFEPVIRQYPEQWFHFVPIWPPAPPRAPDS